MNRWDAEQHQIPAFASKKRHTQTCLALSENEKLEKHVPNDSIVTDCVAKRRSGCFLTTLFSIMHTNSETLENNNTCLQRFTKVCKMVCQSFPRFARVRVRTSKLTQVCKPALKSFTNYFLTVFEVRIQRAPQVDKGL